VLHYSFKSHLVQGTKIINHWVDVWIPNACRSVCTFITKWWYFGDKWNCCWMTLLLTHFANLCPIFIKLLLGAEWCWLFINLSISNIKSKYHWMCNTFIFLNLYNWLLVQNGKFKGKRKTQNELHDKETELQVHQLSKTNYKRNIIWQLSLIQIYMCCWFQWAWCKL
jgi:hypothetical protein